MSTETVFEVPEISAKQAADILGQPLMSTIRWATFEFGIRGLSPIMLDRMTQAQVLGLITGQKVDYPKDEPLETKARRKMYSDAYGDDMPDGAFGFPKENLEACLRDAGVAVQYGSGKNDRVTMATKGTELHYFMRFRQPFYQLLGLDGKPAGWEVDLRKGNATQGTGAVGIIRARFDEWGVVGHVDVNDKGKLCFPRFGGHKQLERLLVANVPDDLPRSSLSSFQPDLKLEVNDLKGNEGIVERWYDARNMGCIVTSQGFARVHWSEAPARPRRRFLVAGERVQFTELKRPPQNQKTKWRKTRKARFKLQASGVTIGT